MSQHDKTEMQRIACPAALKTQLQVYRVGRGNEQHYRAIDAQGEQYAFEPWQFFVLEVLADCESFVRLAAAFEERFNRPLAAGEVDELFLRLAKHELFAVTITEHPLVAPFGKEQEVRVSAPVRKPATAGDEKKVRPIPAAAKDAPAPPGVSEVLGMDDARTGIIWSLFNPIRPLKLLHPFLRPLRHVLYLLPLAIATSLYALSNHFDAMAADLWQPASIAYLLVMFLVVSFLVTAVTMWVAHSFRATVTGFCIQAGMLPGFMARIKDGKSLSRRELIWLHAAPLLTRMLLFGAGILLWLSTRPHATVYSNAGLALALTSAISFLLAANPLIRDSVYHMIGAYSGEAFIRQRSRQVMLGQLRGGSYTKLDRDVLVAYALALATYAVVVIGIVVLIVRAVFDLQPGGFVVALLVILGVTVAWRSVKQFRELGAGHERKTQFQRWRKGDLPKGEIETEENAKLGALARYALRAAAVMLLVVLFLPYSREVSGRIVVLPLEKQDVTSEVSGIIETIHFDGGERLVRGTEIGRLSVTEHAAQVKILTAKITEQQAVVTELIFTPRPEEVDVAALNLRTEETRAQFSGAELARMEKLYLDKTVSFEDLEDARREHELDVKRVAEKRASLDLIKAGASIDEIAAAEAKLQSWKEERELYLEKMAKSVFYAPIEGTLVATHLKQRVGSYFERGQPLAVVENTNEVFVQIAVPEEDIGYVHDQAKVRVRFPTYSGRDIEGSVTSLGPTVTEGTSGRVLQVSALIDNQDGELKTGMEGYAKISGDSLPVWKVLSLGLMRFFNIEAWSWLP